MDLGVNDIQGGWNSDCSQEMVIGPFLQTNQDSPWIYGLASGMISFILWGVETLWHMTPWSTMNDWETSSGWFCSSFDVCHEALSKDEKAAILADIEDEKQKKLQVPFRSNVSSTSTRACFCVFVSSITLRCLELQVPISWVAATLWTKPTDPTLLVFWDFLCSATGLAGKAKAAAEKDVLSVFGWVFWSMLQQQDLFLSDFGGIQCLLPAYCGICRWTVATTKPWRKKQQEQKVQDAQRRGRASFTTLLRYLWRFGDLGAGCLSLSGPRLSRPRLLKRSDESRRPKGSSLLRNELSSYHRCWRCIMLMPNLESNQIDRWQSWRNGWSSTALRFFRCCWSVVCPFGLKSQKRDSRW